MAKAQGSEERQVTGDDEHITPFHPSVSRSLLQPALRGRLGPLAMDEPGLGEGMRGDRLPVYACGAEEARQARPIKPFEQ